MKKIVGFLALTGLLLLAGCSNKATGSDTDTLKVGASPTPHAEILEHIKPLLKKKGLIWRL